MKVNRIRLDIGRDPAKGEIEFRNLNFSHLGEKIIVKLDELLPNNFVKVRGQRIRLNAIGELYNPYFVIEGEVIQKYDSLRLVSRIDGMN